MSNHSEFTCKIAVLGPPCVGKTALIKQFIEHSFEPNYDPTVEEHYTTRIRIQDELCNVQIFDTPGDKNYESLRDEYISKADGFLFVYGASHSLQELGELCLLYKKVVTDQDQIPPIVLVGNKCDVLENRKMTYDMGVDFAKTLNAVAFFETSAKQRKNVEECFLEILRHCVNKKRRSKKDSDNWLKVKKRMSASLKRVSVNGLNVLKRMSLNYLNTKG